MHCKTIIVTELLKGLKQEITKINSTVFAGINTFEFCTKNRLKLMICQTNAPIFITLEEPRVEPIKPCKTSGIICRVKQPPQDVKRMFVTHLAGTCSKWSRRKRRFQQSETAVFVIRVYFVDSKDGNSEFVIIEESYQFCVLKSKSQVRRSTERHSSELNLCKHAINLIQHSPLDGP